MVAVPDYTGEIGTPGVSAQDSPSMTALLTKLAGVTTDLANAINDILDGATFTGGLIVPDEAYDATAWDGSLEVPTKNAVRDKFESLGTASSPTSAKVDAAQSTSSTSYTDLTTVGPAVTKTTGTSALVVVSAWVEPSTDSGRGFVSPAVSGASTVAASDAQALVIGAPGLGVGQALAMALLFEGLTAGSNTFTCKYRTATGTSSFKHRTITAFAL